MTDEQVKQVLDAYRARLEKEGYTPHQIDFDRTTASFPRSRQLEHVAWMCGEIQRALDEQADRAAAGAAHDLDVHVRTHRAIGLQHARKPVVLALPPGGEPQPAAAAVGDLADCGLRAIQGAQHLVGRAQQALARAGQDHPLARAQEQRRAQARLEVPQLVAERRLREVQRAARPGQPAERRDGAHEPQMTDFEPHSDRGPR